MIMPQGLDPADFVAKHGADGVRAAATRLAAAGRVHGAPDRRAPRPVHRGRAVGRRRRHAPHPGRAVGSRAPQPVRAHARGPGGRVGIVGDAGAGSTPGRASARGREDHEARVGAGEGRARDAEAPRRATPRRIGRSSASCSRSISAIRRIDDCSWRSSRPTATSPRSPAARIRSSRPRCRRSRSSRSTATAPDYARSVWARLQEFLLKGKSDAIRMRLQKLNPITDTDYDDLFHRTGRSRRRAPSSGPRRAGRRLSGGRNGQGRVTAPNVSYTRFTVAHVLRSTVG